MATVKTWVATVGPYTSQSDAVGSGLQTDKTPVVGTDVLRLNDVSSLTSSALLENRTGVNSVKGSLLQISQDYENAFVLSELDAAGACAVANQNGIANGSNCLVLYAGVARVLLEDGTGANPGAFAYVSANQRGRAVCYHDPTSTHAPTTLAPTTAATTAAPTTLATSLAPTTAAPTTTPPTGWGVPDAYTVNAGTYTSGSLGDLYRSDNARIVFTEVAATPGFDVDFDFSGVPIGLASLNLRIEGFYSGGAFPHGSQLKAYNYLTASWDYLVFTDPVMRNASSDQLYNAGLDPLAHVSVTGEVKIKFVHDTAGMAGHTLNLDKVYLRSDSFTTAATTLATTTPPTTLATTTATTAAPTTVGPTTVAPTTAAPTTLATTAPPTTIVTTLATTAAPATAAPAPGGKQIGFSLEQKKAGTDVLCRVLLRWET